MFRVAICDDEGQQAEQLYKKVQGCLEKYGFQAVLVSYGQSEMLFYDIQDGQKFDLILTDIEMPQMDGMKLAKEIRKYLPEVLILFVTAHVKYAVDAFELSVFRYIPKNELDGRLDRAIVDAFHLMMLQAEKFYLIQTSLKSEKIPLKNIVYIQKDGKNSLISCKDSKVYSVRKSLNDVMEEMNSEDFIFAERGTIVNLAQITGIQKDEIQLWGGVKIQATHTRMDEIKRKMAEFWRGQI